MRIILILLVFIFLGPLEISAQKQAVVFGRVTDLDNGQAIEFVTVFVKGSTQATETDADGQYRILLEPDITHKLVFSRVGYVETEASLAAMRSGIKRNINIKLAPHLSDVQVVIRDSKIEDVGIHLIRY